MMDYVVKNEVSTVTDDGIDAEHIVYMEVQVPGGVHTDEQMREFREQVRENRDQRCSCEHDCCGHWFGGMDNMYQRWNGDREHWIVRLSYRRNY